MLSLLKTFCAVILHYALTATRLKRFKVFPFWGLLGPFWVCFVFLVKCSIFFKHFASGIFTMTKKLGHLIISVGLFLVFFGSLCVFLHILSNPIFSHEFFCKEYLSITPMIIKQILPFPLLGNFGVFLVHFGVCSSNSREPFKIFVTFLFAIFLF